MDKTKRERSTNFNLKEQDLLISLVLKFKSAVENKQGGASAWKNKKSAWRAIQNEFNASSGGIFRSSKTLKIKYEGLKRSVRKKSAAIRSGLYCTNGESIALDSVEEKVKNMISLSNDGLDSMCNSDSLNQTHESPEPLHMKNNNEISNDEIQLSTYLPIKKEPEEKSTFLESLNDNVSNNTPSKQYGSTPTTSSKKWDVTSTSYLRVKNNPALIDNIKKPIDELAQAKLELVLLQKSLLEAEILEKQKEWEFHEKERKWKEEEYKLKLEKLKRELN